MIPPFVFGVPLIGPQSSPDWAVTERLLEGCLRSVRAQTDAAFQLLLAGHRRPDFWDTLVGADPRFVFIEADWPEEAVTEANDDGGRKKWLIKARCRSLGPSLLMFLDADDRVDHRLVEAARSAIGPTLEGALVKTGWMLDDASGHALRAPHPEVYDQGFDRICGSCAIARIDPEAADADRRDPHQALGSHHEWRESARARGWMLASLPVEGVYVIGHPVSHSETEGPHRAWRRELTDAVRKRGAPPDEAFWRRFGGASRRREQGQD